MSKPTITRSTPLRINKTAVRRFSRDKLPPSRTFYEGELGELRRPNSKGWAQPKAGCPFHESRSKTSFAVNINHGGWVCRAGCGKGDMVKFVERLHGLDFLDAAEYLGALEDGPPAQDSTELVQYLTFEYDLHGDHYRESVKDEPRDYAQRIRRFFRAPGAQLTALGLEEAGSDEAEICWARLALGLDELREVGIL